MPQEDPERHKTGPAGFTAISKLGQSPFDMAMENGCPSLANLDL